MGLFEGGYAAVARGLQGRVLHVGKDWFTIVEVQGFSRRENERGIYRPLLEMAPGTAYFPRSRNTILPLVATKDGQGIGGCVLIREIIGSDNTVYAGPGSVSDILGITEHGTVGRVVEQKNGDLVLEVTGRGAPKKNGNARKAGEGKKPGIGPKAVQRHMPAITKRYLAQGAGQKFVDYLSELLAKCNTEEELRRTLAA